MHNDLKTIKNLKSERVDDYGIDGLYTLYYLKTDKVYWFKIPNEVANTLNEYEEVATISEYYDETGGVENE